MNVLFMSQALHSPEQKKSHATPEELVRCTKSITVATAKAVAAGNSCKQDDIIVAANMGRKAISDMLTICKVLDPIYCKVVVCCVRM
jgi:talin